MYEMIAFGGFLMLVGIAIILFTGYGESDDDGNDYDESDDW
jgi:hypothetical protein